MSDNSGANQTKTCCAPARDAGQPAPDLAGLMHHRTARFDHEKVLIPGGKALLGTAHPGLPEDGESPLRKKTIASFQMAPTTVTNRDFAEFVAATGYQTEAERFGWSFVFYDDVPEEHSLTQGVVGVEWWRRVDGANWRDINGPGTAETAWHEDHPVVQVSWSDAKAYAAWVGGRLPTEAEWEHAARGGLGDVPFPWGNEQPNDTGHFPCNIWQGQFPANNTLADGWKSTAPAQSFQPNGYGLYNMVGNVWEWTADPFGIKSLKKSVKQRMQSMKGFKLLKGGSFLCHRSYCYRYRIAARSGNSPDSATPHQGFRVVWDH